MQRLPVLGAAAMIGAMAACRAPGPGAGASAVGLADAGSAEIATSSPAGKSLPDERIVAIATEHALRTYKNEFPDRTVAGAGVDNRFGTMCVVAVWFERMADLDAEVDVDARTGEVLRSRLVGGF
jgi:hypothetical protein